jgi:hypothetical protein
MQWPERAGDEGVDEKTNNFLALSQSIPYNPRPVKKVI